MTTTTTPSPPLMGGQRVARGQLGAQPLGRQPLGQQAGGRQQPPYVPLAERPSSLAAFALFILVNAVLLIRPAEVFADLQGIEIYFYVIGACSLLAAGDVLRYLIGRPLHTQPITVCVLALLGAALLPHLVTWNLEELWRTSFHFFKQVVYFMLFVSLVNTPGRLRTFLAFLPVIGAVIVVIALLEYYQIVSLTAVMAVEDNVVGSWGDVTTIERLRFSGILSDPNEVCVWLATLLPLVLGNLLLERNTLRRGLWLALVVLFGYAIYLTHSRGGFLAMLVGLGATVAMRYGRQRAALLAAIGLPIVLLLFAGRQTNLDLSSTGTGQSRVRIWSEWLERFRDSPLVGEGLSYEDLNPERLKQLRELGVQVGHVAHNSYLQAFADVGFLGGCLFLGAFGVALWSVWRIGRHRGMRLDPQTHALQPFVLGAAAAYCTGMLTLSLWIFTPTYIVLALAAVYPRLCRTYPAARPVRFDVRLLGVFLLLGMAYLAAMYVFVRLFVNWG